MELNLQALFSQTQKNAEDSYLLDVSKQELEGFSVQEPLQVQYKAMASNGAVELTLCVLAKISAECARCTQPLEKDWTLERSFRITPQDLQEEFLEFPFTAAAGLDLDELAYSELVMDVDSVLLCQESCQGLCMHCGCAKEKCVCEIKETSLDPRWQVLRDLLDEEETKS